MLKLLSHWVMCWLELVLALPPSSGTCKALGSPKIPHSCHEHKPTMKSITAERDGQAWALRPTSAESRSSDTVPMGRGWTPVCSFMNVCVLSCKGFHTGPLVPVTFRSTAVLHLLLGNAVECLSGSDGARGEASWPALSGYWRLSETRRLLKPHDLRKIYHALLGTGHDVSHKQVQEVGTWPCPGKSCLQRRLFQATQLRAKCHLRPLVFSPLKPVM